MKENPPPHRPISVVAREALLESAKLSSTARQQFRRLDGVDQVTSEESYAALALARQLARSWRSNLAKRIKTEIDTILSLYRVSMWDREAGGRRSVSNDGSGHHEAAAG